MPYQNTRRRFLRSAGAVGAGLALSGCLGATGGDDDTVSIGAIAGLSGPFAPWGRSSLAGAQFAAQELNDSADFDRTVEILEGDSGSDPSEAANLFEQFASQGAVGMVGMTSSDVMLRLRQLAEQNQIPQFVNTPGTKELLPEGTRFTFRMNLGSIHMIQQAHAELIQERGYERIGAIVADYAWGRANQQAIEEFIQPLSGVETQVEVAPVSTSDFTSYLRRMQEFEPDVMMTSGHPPGAAPIASGQFQLGVDPEITLGVAQPAPIWWDVLGEDVFRGIVEWSPFDPTSDAYLDFAQQFYQEHERYADQFVGVGYSAVKLIANAIQESGSTDPAEITETVRSSSYETFFAYPFSFTDWGELDQSRLVFTEFAEGPPARGSNPDASWHLEAMATTSRLEPPEPPQSE
ncbi:ABC transporter substrate-binding protein [Halobellus sp. GM3]|uniref:ABC transporter substrate-binding protein n=1 Tax=Halobellus sp. GM3 TaxID=3458410 RepID=UPI00403E043D